MIQPRELPISQKASFVTIKGTKTAQSVHIYRGRPMRVLIGLKVQFHDTKRVLTHRKDSQTYNPSLSKDIKVYV